MVLRVMGKISVLGSDAGLTCVISTEPLLTHTPVVGEIEYRQDFKSEERGYIGNRCGTQASGKLARDFIGSLS